MDEEGLFPAEDSFGRSTDADFVGQGAQRSSCQIRPKSRLAFADGQVVLPEGHFFAAQLGLFGDIGGGEDQVNGPLQSHQRPDVARLPLHLLPDVDKQPVRGRVGAQRVAIQVWTGTISIQMRLKRTSGDQKGLCTTYPESDRPRPSAEAKTEGR